MKFVWITAFIFCNVLHFSIAGNIPSKKEVETTILLSDDIDFVGNATSKDEVEPQVPIVDDVDFAGNTTSNEEDKPRSSITGDVEFANNATSKKENEPKNAIAGGVDFAIRSSIIPAHVRQALAVGKSVYENYLKDSGESPETNEKELESVIGSKPGMGLSLDTVRNVFGNAWELVVTSPLISQNNKKALAAGRAAYEKYLENMNTDSGNNTRIFSTQSLEVVEIVADGGVNYAIGSRAVPIVVKGALATGKAFQKGWKTFIQTRNFTEVRIAFFGSGLESVDNIVRTSPAVALAKAGTGLVKDLYHGKDVKSALTDRGEDVLVSIGGGVAEVAIGAAKGLKSGEIQDALLRGKEMITSKTNTDRLEEIEMMPINEMESSEDNIDAEMMEIYNFLKSL